MLHHIDFCCFAARSRKHTRKSIQMHGSKNIAAIMIKPNAHTAIGTINKLNASNEVEIHVGARCQLRVSFSVPSGYDFPSIQIHIRHVACREPWRLATFVRIAEFSSCWLCCARANIHFGPFQWVKCVFLGLPSLRQSGELKYAKPIRKHFLYVLYL